MNINVSINFNSWDRIISRIKIIIVVVLFTITNSCVHVKITKDTFDYRYYELKKVFAWMNPEIYDIIKTEANQQRSKIDIHVDYVKLISSVIMAESGEFCNNNYEYMKVVISYASARGLMQVIPRFHAPKDPDSLYNPKINVHKGVMYFTHCLQKSIKEGHKNPIRIACLYYNAGAGAKIWRYRNWGYVNKIERYYGKA